MRRRSGPPKPSDRPTIIERVARAYQSSDLALRREGGIGDAEVLLAAGMSAYRRQLAAELHRLLYAQDHAAFESARGHWRAFVVRFARREGWIVEWGNRSSPPSVRELHELADGVLKRRLNDACPACHGRGHPLMPGGTQGYVMALQIRNCDRCGGEGRIAFRGKNPWWTTKGAWLSGEIDAMVAGFGQRVKRKLGRP